MAIAAVALAVASCSIDDVPELGSSGESVAPQLVSESSVSALGPMETWARLIEILETDELDANDGELAVLADPLVVEDLRLLVPSGGEIVSQPNLSASSVATAVVADCAILPAPAFDGPQPSVAIRANLTLKETGWKVTSLTEVALAGCITESQLEAVLDGYKQYWLAVPDYWDPADPTHSAIAATTVGRQREITIERLEQFVADGKVFRLGVAAAPEVVATDSITEVTIFDCQLLHEGHGVFDADTDERLSDIPQIADGDRQGLVVTMELDNGFWKVSWIEAEERNDCTLGASGRALGVVAG